MTLLWTEGKATYRGVQFKVENATCESVSIQKPYPSVTVAAKRPSVFSLAVRYADTVEGFYPADKFKRRIERLRMASRIGLPRFSLPVNICIAQTDAEAEDRYQRYLSDRAFSRKRDERLRKRDIVGSPESCAQQLRTYMDIGVTRFTLMFVDVAKLAPLRLFANEVAPIFSAN